MPPGNLQIERQERRFHLAANMKIGLPHGARLGSRAKKEQRIFLVQFLFFQDIISNYVQFLFGVKFFDFASRQGMQTRRGIAHTEAHNVHRSVKKIIS